MKIAMINDWEMFFIVEVIFKILKGNCNMVLKQALTRIFQGYY